MRDEEILWHISLFSEEKNWLESEYIAFIIRLAEKKLGERYRKILDIPCGVGRHHKYLRDLGFEVYGVDINEELIKAAKERNKGFEDYYEVNDMRKIDYNEEFDVVLNWFTSFGYFDDYTNRDVLRKFYRALRLGGLFILDVPATATFQDVQVKDFGDYLTIERWEKLDYRTLHLVFDLYRKEGKDLKYLKSLDVNLIIYPPLELKEMLENTGFDILFVFKSRSISDVKKKLEEVRDGRLVWVCYRPE